MRIDQVDQLDQLGGGGFGAGLFFDRPENVQVEAFRKIGEAVVEGDQFPGGKAGQLCFAVGLQGIS